MSMQGTDSASSAPRTPTPNGRLPGSRSRGSRSLGLWLLLGATTFAIALLLPPTGDDWTRIAFEPRTPAGWWDTAVGSYVNHNGRIVGNTLSFVLIDPPWVRAAAKALTIVALVAAIRWTIGARSVASVLLCFAGVLLLPAAVFRESYGWSAGFYNYVPPMLPLVLMVGLLTRGPRRARRPWLPPLCVLLAFAGCLFVEHVTAAILLLGLAGITWPSLRRRATAPVAAALAVGALAGTIVMLASPGLRAVADHDDAYFSYPSTLGEAAANATTNFAIITQDFVLSNRVLLALVFLTGWGLVVLARRTGRARGTDLVLAVGVTAVTAYAAITRTVARDRLVCPTGEVASCDLPALGADALALLVLVGALLVGGLPHLRRSVERRAFSGLLAATVLMLGPLLIVGPIGPRNVYGPTVTLVAMLTLLALPLLEPAEPETERAGAPGAAVATPAPGTADLGTLARGTHAPGRPAAVRVVTLVLALALAAGVAGLVTIQAGNAQVAAERVRLMEGAVTAGRRTVTLPPFPHPEWVHHPKDAKIGIRYYRNKPRDIKITFAPPESAARSGSGPSGMR